MDHHTITPEQLKRKIEQGDKVYILDVRDLEKYQAGTFNHTGVVAGNIPYVRMIEESGEGKVLESLPDGTEIVTVCTSGNKARKAASLLRDRGYKASTLQGGLTAWAEK